MQVTDERKKCSLHLTENLIVSFSPPEPRILCLRTTQGSGKRYVGEHAPYGSYSQKLAIWILRRLLIPRGNMNAPIRGAFDCL